MRRYQVVTIGDPSTYSVHDMHETRTVNIVPMTHDDAVALCERLNIQYESIFVRRFDG